MVRVASANLYLFTCKWPKRICTFKTYWIFIYCVILLTVKVFVKTITSMCHLNRSVDGAVGKEIIRINLTFFFAGDVNNLG